MRAVVPDPPHAHGRSKQADHRTGQPHRGHCPQPFEPTEHQGKYRYFAGEQTPTMWPGRIAISRVDRRRKIQQQLTIVLTAIRPFATAHA